MNEKQHLTTICVGETKTNFLIAVKEPMDAESQAFNELNSFAHSVRELDEGSQVFVYDRLVFGNSSLVQEEGVIEYLNAIASEVGSLAIHPTIRSLNGGNAT